MIRIAVVDDNPGYARQMRSFIERYATERKETVETDVFLDGLFLVEIIRRGTISFLWISR
ncbi:MAG: hypothetical protein LUG93_15210 [Lachnospiraceae bacterium]|nr:hypothetical protein [Lachnospiraceae bacterium]